MGSVKDLEIIKKPIKERAGIGRFHFSDRYSVFDWGEMPDKIKNKGKALCMIGAFFFEKCSERGIKTHYRGLVENGKVKRIDEVDLPVNTMEIKLLRVLKPELKDFGYDYSVFKNVNKNYLIPLEVIYRNIIHKDSSIFRRLREGKSLRELGLEKVPVPGEKLEKPLIDFSTKLEEKDRYLSKKEALEISGLKNEDFRKMISVAMKLNELISEEIGKVGIVNEDGKFEFGLDDDANIMVVDVFGTPDECRFKFGGVEISKEVLREYYRGTKWYKEIERVKGEKEWKKRINAVPEKVPEELRKVVEKMYMATCNEITGRKFFDVDSLREVIATYIEIKEKYFI